MIRIAEIYRPAALRRWYRGCISSFTSAQRAPEKS